MNITRFHNIFLIFSALVMVASIASIAFFGLQVGIEFTGGSLLQIEYQNERPSSSEIRDQLVGLNVGNPVVQPVENNSVIIRMKDLSEDVHQEVLRALGEEAVEMRFESIGPVIGRELKDKALLLTGISLLAIIIYVTFAFRKITRPVRSWQWSLSALVALLHDLLIPLGIFAIVGEEITIPVVVALLTVVGYSVNDTVVVFDRVRENLMKKIGFDFADTVNISLRQAFFRSFNTSVTTLFVVVSILLFGGETLQGFALAMTIGILAGTYSSLFSAPMLLLKSAGRDRG